MGTLDLEVVISSSSKYKKKLSIVIQITLVNYFTIKFSSHTLFSFMDHISIINEGKKNLKK
jgi:hypothetical protein